MFLYFLLPQINLALATGGLILLVVTVALYADYFIFRGKYFADLLRKVSWPIVMAVTTGCVFVSLLYSEYFGYVPCSLCWLQRIALYPQALLSILAFTRRDEKFFPVYGIGLSVFGLLVALYQYVEQMWPKAVSTASGVLPCLADGSNADCADKIIDEFGFVTFPFISAVALAFLIVVYLYMLRRNNTSV